MHDLPDDYSKAIAAATHKANAARRAALHTYEERQDEINAEFEADIAAAGAALEAGIDSRMRTFRGEYARTDSRVGDGLTEPALADHNQESEVRESTEAQLGHDPNKEASGDAEPRHVAGGARPDSVKKSLLAGWHHPDEPAKMIGAEKAAREEEDRRFLESMPTVSA